MESGETQVVLKGSHVLSDFWCLKQPMSGCPWLVARRPWTVVSEWTEMTFASSSGQKSSKASNKFRYCCFWCVYSHLLEATDDF